MPGPLTRAAGGGTPGATPIAQAMGNLDRLDRFFLGGLRGAENLGLGGTSLRLYNDVIQRGRRDPITEQDFVPEEIEGLRRLVEKKRAETGAAAGRIDYPDYRGSGVSVNMLGGFGYATDPAGNVSITDRYDFNPLAASEQSGHDKSVWLRALGSAFAPVVMAGDIGRRVIPPGKGVDVRLNLGGAR